MITNRKVLPGQVFTRIGREDLIVEEEVELAQRIRPVIERFEN